MEPVKYGTCKNLISNGHETNLADGISGSSRAKFPATASISLWSMGKVSAPSPPKGMLSITIMGFCKDFLAKVSFAILSSEQRGVFQTCRMIENISLNILDFQTFWILP